MFRNKKLWSFAVLFPVFVAVFIYAGLVPYIEAGSKDAKILGHVYVQKAVEEFEEKIKEKGSPPVISERKEVAINPFVYYDVEFEARRYKESDGGYVIKQNAYGAKARWDVLFISVVLAIAAWFVGGILLYEVKPIPEIEHDNSDSISSAFDEDLYKNQVVANRLFARSTMLLVTGIIMAFMGIGVFYFSLPDADFANSSVEQYVLSIIRPIFILLFIEAVSWFLLKQYRALLSDYKEFNDVCVRRANYKMSYDLLKEPSGGVVYEKLIDSLLNTPAIAESAAPLRTDPVNYQEGGPLWALVNNMVEKARINSSSADSASDPKGGAAQEAKKGATAESV